MAEALFNALAEDQGLEARAQSAGVAALKGEPIAPNARAALEEIGAYPEKYSARQVSIEMLEEADLVLTMCPRHIAELRRVFGDSFRARALPEYAGGASSEEGSPTPTGAPCPPTDLPYASSAATWIFSWTVSRGRRGLPSYLATLQENCTSVTEDAPKDGLTIYAGVLARVYTRNYHDAYVPLILG